ncbi:MAG: tetratricopeptide repeat protein [Bacteroidia bacterium]
MKLIRLIYCVWSLMMVISCNSGKNEQAETNKSSDSLNQDDVFYQLNQKILRNPGDAEAYFHRAKINLEKNLIQAAFSDASKAAFLDSNKVEYLLLLADVSFRGLQVRKSIESYERCLKVDPQNLEANLKLAEIYLYIKGYAKSISYANAALKIDPKKVKAYFLKGFVHKESGDTAKALSSFETVVDLDPENYDAHIQLGNLYAAMRNKIALQYYSNALSLRPTSTEALYDRGLFLQNIGEFNKAIGDYKVLLKIDPKYSDAYFNIGYIALVFRKDYPTAIDWLSKAISVNENYAEAYYNRGLAYEFEGENEKAIADYRKALGIFPTYKLATERIRLLTVKK